VFGRYAAESIRNCQFFLDANVDVQAMAALLAYPLGGRNKGGTIDTYNPSSARVLIQANQRNYSVEDDCVWLHHLPNGNHVLSVVTDRRRPDTITSLAHVVVF